MSYFVSKIGHLDPRFYSLIYCAIPGVQMSGVQMSDFISKIGHLDPRFYSVIYCAIPGFQMSGVQMSGVQMSGSRCRGPDVPHSALLLELSSCGSLVSASLNNHVLVL